MKLDNGDLNQDTPENINYDVAYFYNLDSENRICIDCGGPFPTCVSINNGVFLCKFCGENHKAKLNYNISFIHEINSGWDQYLLSFATRGGNSRFKRLCLQYEVPCQSLTQNDDEKLNKYLIRLGEYNRLLLKSEINCDEPPPPLYQEVAKDPINENIIYFPEFQNYQLFKGNLENNQKNGNNNASTVGDKIWEGTKTTFDIMKKSTGIIYNTSKPIVSFLGNAAFSGLKFVGTSVWNYMNNNETNNGEGNTPNDKNTPLNNNNNSQNNYNGGNNNMQMQNFPNQNPNNFNYNNNNYNNYNNNNHNNNYLTNSNKFNIFTINNNGILNNTTSNNNNNMIPKPTKNNPYNSNKNKNNNIPNYYDINSINNESVNNITFYLNNNNSFNSMSKANNDFNKQKSILDHENIIVNEKYINDKNFLIYNDKKDKNNINQTNNNINKINLNNNPLYMNIPGVNNKLVANVQNNKYPSFNEYFGNDNNIINNNSNNDILMDKEINDKNVPNIIGEEINQEKAKYPIYQSTNLLNDNSFLPKEVTEKNEFNSPC